MSSWKTLTARLGHGLVLYGGWGLFAISFLDSTFIPFPLVNDLLLMHLSSRAPTLMPFYVLGCTAGSVLGAYVLYGLGTGGGKFLHRMFTEERMVRAERWIARHDFVSVLVVSLLPAPAPFKLFLISAGALRMASWRYGAALVVGRGARFAGEGWLAMVYGARAEAYLRANLARVSIIFAVLVVVFTVAFRALAKRTPSAPKPSPESQE